VPDEPPFDPEYDLPRHDTGVTRLPPQDIAAERIVLGAAMLDPTVLDKCTDIITGADFYKPAHETIWRALLHLHTHNDPTDPAAIANHLRASGELKRTGGPEYLHDLMTAAPMTAGDATYHAHTIDQLARRRTAIATLEQGLQRLRSPGHDTDVDEILAGTADHFTKARDQLVNPTPPSTWAALDLTAVLEGKELDPPPALLARTDGQLLLYAGAVHTISGEPTSGKTWLTLLACVQELDQGNTVTMLDFEDRATRVVGRLLGLGAKPDDVYHRFRYVRPNARLDNGGHPALDAAIHDATLVIIDGVTEVMGLHGLDPNSNPDIATFYGLLPRRIADQGPAVALIDHVVKDGEKQGRWALGGGHKLAGLDGVAYLIRNIEPFGRGKVGHSRVTIGKDRPGYVEEVAIGRSIGELWLDARDQNILRCDLRPSVAVPTDDAGQMRPTYLMEKISRWLELTPGANASAIYEMKFGRKTYVLRALSSLIQEGYVEASTGPGRQTFHHVATPYREEES
jgi:hypothetical protein